MAKIDTLNFVINGKKFYSNINVGKSGQFKIHLNWEVAEAIGLDSVILSDNLEGVSGVVNRAYSDYCESKTKYSLHIQITYKANKAFVFNKDGNVMFPQFDSNYRPSSSFSDTSELHFGYKIYCKEVRSTGVEVWHNTQKLDDDFEQCDNDVIVEGFRLSGSAHGVNGKLIPYSEQSIKTLSKAQEGLRIISEILFNFINQEPDEITATLNTGNLLNK